MRLIILFAVTSVNYYLKKFYADFFSETSCILFITRKKIVEVLSYYKFIIQVSIFFLWVKLIYFLTIVNK